MHRVLAKLGQVRSLGGRSLVDLKGGGRKARDRRDVLSG